MLLSVIVVSWNTRELLRASLRSLKEELVNLTGSADFAAENSNASNSDASKSEVEVFVVDNNSADQSAEMVAADFPWVKLTANADNRGFAAGNNQALAHATGQFVLLLNPDTEIVPGALRTLIQFFDSHPQAGVVAPQLLNSDGSIQRSCRSFPTFLGMVFELIGLSKMFSPGSKYGAKFREYKMLDWNHDDERQVDQPEGACLLIKRELLDQIGTLDEGFFMLFEEVDWCFRAKKAGWQIWFTPSAQVVHHYGQSIKQVKVRMILSSHRGLYRFWHKHYRGNRWWLDGIAFGGLMALAYVRIAAYSLRKVFS